MSRPSLSPEEAAMEQGMSSPRLQSLPRLQYLRWFDLIILTAIFWGDAIYSSALSYQMLLSGYTTIEQNLTFSTSDTYMALATQAVSLLLGLCYLRLRRFDFKLWHIRFRPTDLALCVPIFLGGALLMDGWILLSDRFAHLLPFPAPMLFGEEAFPSILYALFNGLYEELFFLGICLSVRPKSLKWALPFSLLVRFSFHTYQGMMSALGIGFLFGGYLYLLYSKSKDKNLLPFWLAHAIADVTGLGILWLLYG